jgi:hypothetical protein
MLDNAHENLKVTIMPSYIMHEYESKESEEAEKATKNI